MLQVITKVSCLKIIEKFYVLRKTKRDNQTIPVQLAPVQTSTSSHSTYNLDWLLIVEHLAVLLRHDEVKDVLQYSTGLRSSC